MSVVGILVVAFSGSVVVDGCGVQQRGDGSLGFCLLYVVLGLFLGFNVFIWFAHLGLMH